MHNKLIKFLLNLKNYSGLKKEFLIIKFSSGILKILNGLYKEGFIQSYKIINISQQNYFYIVLRYYFNKPIFKNLKIISKPSNLKYLKFKVLIKLCEKKINYFVSTDKGIFTLKECKKKKLGGKILFCC